MSGKQSSAMEKAEKQFRQELSEGKRPNIGEIARKYKLAVSAFYNSRWYKELKSLGKL